MWITGVSDKNMDPIKVYQDNNACISLQRTGPKPNHKSKYIDIRHFWAGSLEDENIISTIKCGTKCMLADINTKPKHGIIFMVLWKRSTGELFGWNVNDDDWNAAEQIALLNDNRSASGGV